jgi:hypothetical protein
VQTPRSHLHFSLPAPLIRHSSRCDLRYSCVLHIGSAGCGRMRKHSLDIDYVLYSPLILELSAELSWDAYVGTNATTPRPKCHCGMDYHAFPPSAPLSTAIAQSSMDILAPTSGKGIIRGFSPHLQLAHLVIRVSTSLYVHRGDPIGRKQEFDGSRLQCVWLRPSPHLKLQ